MRLRLKYANHAFSHGRMSQRWRLSGVKVALGLFLGSSSEDNLPSPVLATAQTARAHRQHGRA
jgi:hypothetical protein